MSFSGWAHGDIKLPPKERTRVKKEFTKAWNTYYTRLFERADAEYNRIYPVAKKISGKKRESFLYSQFDNMDWEVRTFLESRTSKRALTIKRPTNADRKRMLATQRTSKFDSQDYMILFIDDGHLHIDIPEGNHAVEAANEHPPLNALYQILDNVKWTTQSGGLIIGNDEINQDNYGEGEASNYVIQRYGNEMTKYRRSLGLKV